MVEVIDTERIVWRLEKQVEESVGRMEGSREELGDTGSRQAGERKGLRDTRPQKSAGV